MRSLSRLARIVFVGLRFGLHDFVPPLAGNRLLDALSGSTARPRAIRLREALEALGPIFVKFGQVLSTRRDLLPLDVADELAKLQDQVPPFPSQQALDEVERGLGKPIHAVFASFEREPRASASIAQVHLATLASGEDVAVKVLRPGVEHAVARDVSLLETGAQVMERVWAEGRRLKPREVVAEFAKHLAEELDLLREAANASQLGRNFLNSTLLVVPRVHWDYCSQRVMVMERMHGTPISQVGELVARGIDIPALARAGVEIFFTQVFRDGFFHATCIRETSLCRPRVRRAAATSRSTSASWARSPTATKTTSRRISSASSTATTAASRRRTSMRAGFRPIRGWTISRRRSARYASRSSRGR